MPIASVLALFPLRWLRIAVPPRSVWNNYKILHIAQYVNGNITQYCFWFLMDITQYGEKNGI